MVGVLVGFYMCYPLVLLRLIPDINMRLSRAMVVAVMSVITIEEY